jgi:hypothetical protein
MTPFLSALLLLVAAIPALGAPQASKKVVARVGSYTLTESDLAYRKLVNKVEGFEGDKDYALKQLVDAYTYAQILANQGWKITDETLKEESKRIDRNTQAPKKLAEVKQIFDEDPEAYLRVYVLPTYSERVIYYEFFTMNPAIHDVSKRAPRAFVNDVVKRPQEFSKVAERRKLAVNRFTVSKRSGIRAESNPDADNLAHRVPLPNKRVLAEEPEAEKPTEQMMEEGKRWVDEIVRSLKPGQVFPKVIESQESWLIARYVGPIADDLYQFEGVSFPKASYEQWLEKEKKRVKVRLTP